MNIRTLILSLATGVIFFSCTKEEIVNRSEQINGTATRITLALKSERQQMSEKQGMAQTNRAMQFPYGVPTTGSMIESKTFCPEDESLITNVHILVFDPTGQIVSNNYIGNLKPTSKIVIDTYCGENMNVCAIANTDVNDDPDANQKLNEKLSQVKSAAELRSLLVPTKGNGLSRTERLTMVGGTTLNITPNMASITIQLHYLAAKVTVTVTDDTPADVAMTITGWDLVNIPKRTFLAERGAEAGDAVNGSTAADYATTNENFVFETVNADKKTWEQSFYLFENRRGGRIDRMLPTNPAEIYPDMAFDDIDQRGKAWFAPPGATYMLIYGTYGNPGQINRVIYKIYLGENAYNNYDIVRGKLYKFNVTIKGLNQIDIDTTVDWGNSRFTVTPNGDLEKMDAHPDFRVLRIGATAANANTDGLVMVEVLNENDTPCLWLALSPLNLYRYGIKQSDNQHQPFNNDANGCFVQSIYTPTVVEEVSFDNATFGMTRKLTGIPFPQLAVSTFQDIVIYADAFNGIGQREAKVRVTYYEASNGATPAIVGQQEFKVAQQDAIKITGDLYIERYEESAMTLQPGIPSNLQGTNTDKMQWGYSSQVLYGNQDRYTDGAFLTANAVYKSVTRGNNLDAPTWNLVTSYTDYRDLYPRVGEKVSTPSSLQTESVYFYPVLDNTTISTHYFDPIYNSTAARYCHEKNRDTNGNGIIDEGETVWYLPSLADMIYISDHMPVETNLTGSYWTSTEEDTGNSWSYVFMDGSKSNNKMSVNRVRCVRGKGVASLPDISLSSSQTDPAKIDFESSGSSVAFDIKDKTGLPWTVTSSAPAWLTFKITSTGSDAIASYIGFKDCRLFAYAHENTNTTARTATITLKRRDSSTDKIISVTQARKILPAEITTDNSVLNFFSGESKPFTIDDKENGLPWTVTSSDKSWLLIATDAKGKDASEKKTGTGGIVLYAYTKSKNQNDIKRTATLTLSQTGMVNKTIDITQTHVQAYYPLTNKAWAGCNIYWDPNYINPDGKKGRLTFDDENTTANWDYQGVCFIWGSLVAIAPTQPYNRGSSILFSPVNFSATELPAAGRGLNIPAENNRHYILEAHDPDINIGDICKYITDRGWAPGADEGKKWRLPTAAELGPANKYTWAWGAGKITTVGRNGTTRIPNSPFVYGNLKLPRNGAGNTDAANPWNYDWAGTYMSGTASSVYRTFLYVYTGGAPFIYNGMYANLASVRCVLEPK